MKKKILFICLFSCLMVFLNSCLGLERMSYMVKTTGEILKEKTLEEEIKAYPAGIPVLLKSHYERSGNLFLTQEFRNGKKNGRFKKYYENGNLMIQGTYQEDMPVGIWEIYDFKGKLLKKDSYEECKKFLESLSK